MRFLDLDGAADPPDVERLDPDPMIGRRGTGLVLATRSLEASRFRIYGGRRRGDQPETAAAEVPVDPDGAHSPL